MLAIAKALDECKYIIPKQILDAICWPRDSIDDKQNFVANSKVLPLITKVLDRLSIRFKEGERNE